MGHCVSASGYLSGTFSEKLYVFGLTIALYGVIIALGVLFGFTLANHVANKQGLPKDLLWDFAVPAIISRF